MFKSISQYFSGVGRAMQVRSGRGGVYADAGLASEQLKRLTQVLPKARAEIIAATEAIIQEAVMAEMKATPIAELKDYGASVGPLQSVGFRMVADLSGRSFGSLLNYRGVGDVTAESAIRAFGLFQESARAFGSTCVNRFSCSEANPASAYTPPRPDRTCIARPTPPKYREISPNICTM